MDIFQAIILGVIQGLTEWLPISSRSQLIVVGLNFFGMTAESALRYAIFLHIGTMIAAAVYFRKEYSAVLALKDKALLRFIVIALLATAITAAPVYLLVRKAYTDPFLVMLLIGFGLLVSGLLQFKRKAFGASADNKSAAVVGLAQGFSAIPGISRSGVTTTALLFKGFSPEQAFRLSFLLSVPSVFLAEIGFNLMEGFWFEPVMLLSVAVAAIVGYFSIGLLLRIAKRIRFSWFCVAFGLLYLALAFV